jgi:HK97 family phage major capsid protein
VILLYQSKWAVLLPSWVAEGESPQKSQQIFGQVTLSPKSIAAYTDFSQKLILQASPDIEQLVRDDLATISPLR